jgi:lysophospholipase L1-like esterase
VTDTGHFYILGLTQMSQETKDTTAREQHLTLLNGNHLLVPTDNPTNVMLATTDWVSNKVLGSTFPDNPFPVRVDQSFVFEGDSLTSGYLLSAGQDWPSLAMSLRWFKNRGINNNVSVAGTTLSNMSIRYAANVYPLRPNGEITTVFLFLLGGTNDISGGSSAGSVFSALTSYWAQAKADGFTVVAGTIPTRKDFFGTAKELNRVVLNQMIRESVGHWDYLIDFDVVAGDPYDTTFYLSSNGVLIDGIHPSTTGTAMWAALVNSVMETGTAKTTHHGVQLGRTPQVICDVQATGLSATVSQFNLGAALPGAVFPPGTYQVNLYVYTTTAGSAGTAQGLVTFHNGTTSTFFSGGSVALTTVNGHAGNVFAVHIGQACAMNLGVTVAGNVGGQFAYDVTITRLQ